MNAQSHENQCYREYRNELNRLVQMCATSEEGQRQTRLVRELRQKWEDAVDALENELEQMKGRNDIKG